MKRPLRIRVLLSGAPWSIFPAGGWSRLTDAFIFAAGIALLYGMVRVAQSWLGPFTPQVEISESYGLAALRSIFARQDHGGLWIQPGIYSDVWPHRSLQPEGRAIYDPGP